MTNSIRTTAAIAGLLATLAAPAASQAASVSTVQPQRYTLRTELTDRYHAGAYEATLALTVYPSGIVQGTYRPSDGGIRTVTGGVDGKQIWLDIGSFHGFHVNGTFENGVLKTVAALPGRDVYELNSVETTAR